MKPGISVHQRLWRSNTNRTYFDYLDNNHVSPYHLSYILRIMQVTSLFPNQVQRLKLRSGGFTNLTYFETFVYKFLGVTRITHSLFPFLINLPYNIRDYIGIPQIGYSSNNPKYLISVLTTSLCAQLIYTVAPTGISNIPISALYILTLAISSVKYE